MVSDEVTATLAEPSIFLTLPPLIRFLGLARDPGADCE